MASAGCGTPYADIYADYGDKLGQDENSNMLRVEIGVPHDVGATVGRSGGLVKSTRTLTDSFTAVDPAVVEVTDLKNEIQPRYRIRGLQEGETLLHLTANGNDRFVPIRVVPRGYVF